MQMHSLYNAHPRRLLAPHLDTTLPRHNFQFHFHTDECFFLNLKKNNNNYYN